MKDLELDIIKHFLSPDMLEDTLAKAKYTKEGQEDSDDNRYAAQVHSDGQLAGYLKPSHRPAVTNFINRHKEAFIASHPIEHQPIVRSFFDHVQKTPTQWASVSGDKNQDDIKPRARHLSNLVASHSMDFDASKPSEVKLKVTDPHNLHVTMERHGSNGGASRIDTVGYNKSEGLKNLGGAAHESNSTATNTPAKGTASDGDGVRSSRRLLSSKVSKSEVGNTLERLIAKSLGYESGSVCRVLPVTGSKGTVGEPSASGQDSSLQSSQNHLGPISRASDSVQSNPSFEKSERGPRKSANALRCQLDVLHKSRAARSKSNSVAVEITGSIIKSDTNSIHTSAPESQPRRIHQPAHHDQTSVLSAQRLTDDEARDCERVVLEKGLKHAIAGVAMLASTGTASPAVEHVDHPKTAQVFLHNDLNSIAQIESTGGKNKQHQKTTVGLNAGDTAGGSTGLMPKTIFDAVSHDKNLGKKYGHVLSMKPDEVTQQINANPSMENEIANSHWAHIDKVFGKDHARKAYAWRNGITAAKTASDLDVSNHPYVKKFLALRAQGNVAMNKSVTIGHDMGAPIDATGGAALQLESVGTKIKKLKGKIKKVAKLD